MNIQIGDIVASIGYEFDSIGIVISKDKADLWQIAWLNGIYNIYSTADIYWLKQGWERLQGIGKAGILS
jgi:hypothetical protein